jgi:hypothetical protein
VSIFELLIETAKADIDLLIQNDEFGDDFSVPRDVDFLIRAKTEEQANVIAGFIDDNRYGEVKVTSAEEGFNISVVIHMPIEQPIICSVSGLIACVSNLFGAEFDGWECAIQKKP